MRIIRWLPVFFSLLGLAGCATVRFENASGETKDPSSVLGETFHTVLWGFVPVSHGDPLRGHYVRAGELCPDGGWSSIETRVGWLDAGLRLITAGIYSPWTVEVTCSTRRSD